MLSIQDNGRGITQAEMQHPQSFGLIGMQERIHMLSGEIKVEGIAGKGTTVMVRVPLNQPTGPGGNQSKNVGELRPFSLEPGEGASVPPDPAPALTPTSTSSNSQENARQGEIK